MDASKNWKFSRANVLFFFYLPPQAWRVAARNGLDTDSLSSNIQDFDEEIVEFLVDTKETIIEE